MKNYFGLLRLQQRAEWSIGIYSGTSPLALTPQKGAPVLSRHSVPGKVAHGVADPFMILHEGRWVMFFELENRRSGKGEIGYATSADASTWHFEGIALAEPFHLSYPQVFAVDGDHYMVPEAASSGTTRLYRAAAFPSRWVLEAEIVDAPLADATLFRHADRWWMLALDGFRERDALVLYHAENIAGPWRPHRQNPVLRNDRARARCAGRVIHHEGSLLRFAQDYSLYYGRTVSAFRIDELTPHSYRESPAADAPVLGPGALGWNASGMHHIDAHEIAPGQWIACVDGRRTVTHWPLWDRVSKRLRGAS